MARGELRVGDAERERAAAARRGRSPASLLAGSARLPRAASARRRSLGGLHTAALRDIGPSMELAGLPLLLEDPPRARAVRRAFAELGE